MSHFAAAVSKPSMRRTHGFTLIEMVVVVAIIAILASIAVPAYTDQIRKGRRAEAMNGLEAMAQRQERWRANNPTYGTAAQIVASTSDYYTFAVTVNTANAWTMTATAAGAQATDTRCATMTLTNAGVRTPADCWAR